MCKIRRASPNDAPVIVDYRIRMFQSLLDDSFDYDHIKKFELEYLTEEIRSDRFVAWIGETDEGEPVACSAVSFFQLPPKPWNLEGNYAFISSMYTEPAYRRKGLGGRLLQVALDYACDQGIRDIRLHASESGRSLYKAFGFIDTNEMKLKIS